MNILKAIINTYIDSYPIKIDSYFLCKKTNKIKLNIKFKNKRSIVCIYLQDLLKKNLSEFADNLHPIDICIISILSNRPDLFKITHIPLSLKDNNTTHKIKNFIKIVDHDFSSNEKNISLRVAGSDNVYNISASEFTYNKNLLNALNFQDAFIVGSHMEDQHIDRIITYRQKFNILNGIVISLFCAIFSIYLLSSNENIYISNDKISISIIYIPFMMYLLAYIINTCPYAHCKILFKWHLISTLIFMSYIFFITYLPYNGNNNSIIDMNNLFTKVELHYPITMFIFYLTAFICLEINNKKIVSKYKQIIIMLILIYLIISAVMGSIITFVALSKFDTIYLVLSIVFFLFLFKIRTKN